MKTVILGISYGYTINQLSPFIKSLRRHYSGEVVLLTDNLSDDHIQFLNDYHIRYLMFEKVYEVTSDVQIDRWLHYLNLIHYNYSDYDRFLFTDVGDVIFQSNPFEMTSNYEAEFYEESKLIKDCDYNKFWWEWVYGGEIFEKYSNKKILCSGTVIFGRKGVIDFLNLMIQEIKRVFETVNLYQYKGCDQPIFNKIVYDNLVEDFIIYENEKSSIITLQHVKDLNFNESGQLLNGDGSIPSLLHQWDRKVEWKSYFQKMYFDPIDETLELFSLNQNQSPRVFVVDNFYLFPHEIRQLALSLDYEVDERFYKGSRSKGVYRTLMTKKRFESIIGEKINKWDYGINGCFQITTAEDLQVYHCDEQKWAAVIYLNTDYPIDSGTRLLIHKETGLCHGNDEDILKAFEGGHYDSTKFDITVNASNKFNRLVIMDSRHIHSAGIYFGNSKETGRLVQLFFFD